MLYSSVCSLCSFTFETMPQVLLLLVSKRPRTFITLIMQIRKFLLNLGTCNKNFEAIEDSLGRSFQKELKYILKGIRKKKFFRKTLRCNLNFEYNTIFDFIGADLYGWIIFYILVILNKLLKIILHIRHRI